MDETPYLPVPASHLLPEGSSAGPIGPVVRKNPALVYLASLAPTGRRAVAGQLTQVAQMLGAATLAELPWERLRYEHVQHIRTRLAELGKAPATIRLVLAAIRGVLRTAFALGNYSAEDLERVRQVKPVRGSRLPAGQARSSDEIVRLLSACADGTASGARDAGLLALMYGGGLRRHEPCGLTLESYDASRGVLRLLGKGNKEREQPLPPGAQAALDAWLTVRGGEPGPLFLAINRHGQIRPGRPLTPQAVYTMLKRRAAAAGVENCSPHDLRRSFATDLIDQRGDLSVVQKLMGHANIATTIAYDRRGEEAKRQAVSGLHVPFQPSPEKED